MFWFDWYLTCCALYKGNIATGRWAPNQACLAEWHNCWTFHTINSINWWYIQPVHSILVCSSVHWEADLLTCFWWGCSKSALYVNLNTWLEETVRNIMFIHLSLPNNLIFLGVTHIIRISITKYLVLILVLHFSKEKLISMLIVSMGATWL